MTFLFVIGMIFALMLGYGSGRERRAYYGIGFWGIILTAIIGYINLTVLKASGLLLTMVVVAIISWAINLSIKIRRGLKHSAHEDKK